VSQLTGGLASCFAMLTTPTVPLSDWRTFQKKPPPEPNQRAALPAGTAPSSTKTQSLSPELLRPGGVNSLLPLLANGEPSKSVYWPFVGSYHRAVAVDASFDMSIVIVRLAGR
jgi:hypothetical protein